MRHGGGKRLEGGGRWQGGDKSKKFGRRHRSFERRQGTPPDSTASNSSPTAERPPLHAPHSPPPDMVYGRRPVFEVLQAGKRGMHKLWIAEGVGGGIIGDVIKLAKERGVPIDFLSRQRLDQLAGGGNHQGLVAQVSAIQYLELEDFIKSLPRAPETLVLALDEIQDPQNIGAILRSAGFFGVAGVIVPRWRSAPVGDTAMRTSAGAAEHVPIVRVRNLADAVLTLKEANIPVYCADMAGEPIGTQPLSGPMVLVMGNEGEGVRRLVKERCDKQISIPLRTPLGSLNVGAATAIFLYEFFRLRSK